MNFIQTRCSKFLRIYLKSIIECALIAETINGNLFYVKLYMSIGIVNNSHIALIEATRIGHFDIVKYLFPNHMDMYSRILSLASKENHIDIVKFLIDAPVNDKLSGLNWGLIKATENGNYEIVLLLVKNGANCFIRSLIISASTNHIDIFKYLYNKVNPNLNTKIQLLNISSTKTRNLDIIRYIIDDKVDINNIINVCVKNEIINKMYIEIFFFKKILNTIINDKEFIEDKLKFIYFITD